MPYVFEHGDSDWVAQIFGRRLLPSLVEVASYEQYNSVTNSDVNLPSKWTDVFAAVQDDGLRKTLIVPPATGNRFYRLNKP